MVSRYKLRFMVIILIILSVAVLFAENKKDPLKYLDKSLFLCSSKDWREVLVSVPVLVWTNIDHSISRHPLLILHDEDVDEQIEINFETMYGIFHYAESTIEQTTEVRLEGPSLREGESAGFTMKLINNGNTTQNFNLSFACRPQFSISSAEVVVACGNSYCSLTTTSFERFNLSPGQSKSYHLDITCHKIIGGSFDIDSIVYFMQQYSPEKITLLGNVPEGLDAILRQPDPPGAGIDSSIIEKVQIHNVFSYWSEWGDVVVVENNYEMALQAAVYASLLNAPLIIEGYNDYPDLSGKNIICMGETTLKGNEAYTAEEIRKLYIQKTKTKKVVITNPDLNICKRDIKETEKTGTIVQLFGKTSLAAPYLAASKHQIILPVNSTDANAIDAELEKYVLNLNVNPEYLTILGSPLEIQQTIILDESYTDVNGYHKVLKYKSIDNSLYGNMDNDKTGFAEMKTGRIYGFSISDVSTYIARSVFIDQLKKADDFLFVGMTTVPIEWEAEINTSVFKQAGYKTSFRTNANPPAPLDWANKCFINNSAHGNQYGTNITTGEIPLLDNTIVFASSCLLAAFDHLAPAQYGKLFALQLLRKGASGVLASTDTGGFAFGTTLLNSVLQNDLGTTNLIEKNIGKARHMWYCDEFLDSDYNKLKADIQFLLGDPTLKINFKKPILPEVNQEISYSPDKIEITVIVPSYSCQLDDKKYIFIEGTDAVYQDKDATFFLKCGPLKLFENYTIEIKDLKNPVWEGIKETFIQTNQAGTYIYFQIKKDLSNNLPNQLVENSINISIIKQAPVFNLSAGMDQELDYPDNKTILNGSVDVSSLPEARRLLCQWSVLDGPGPVVFDQSNSLITQAIFSTPGVYTLQLRARVPLNSNFDTVKITVYEEIKLGDVNNDKQVNIVDALMIAQYYVGMEPSPFVKKAGDVNQNGTIDIIDALIVAQFYVGIISGF